MKKKFTILKTMLLAVIMLVVGNVSLFGAEIITFEFSALAGGEATATSNANDANLNASTISRGSGLTASANAARFNATNWALTSIAKAVSGNRYMEFTVSPKSGYQFNVSSIVVQWQRSATGNTKISLRSSVDSYATDLDAVKTVADVTTTQTFTWTFAQSNSSSNVTYRLYSYAEAGTGSGGPGDGTGNDIVVNGTVSSTGNIAPTVTTQAATVIGVTAATGNGNISATGGVNPTVRGICWDLAANVDPDINDSKVEETGAFSTGAFTGSLSSLTAGTQYKVRAYATNTEGTSYGGVQTFYTLSTEPSAHSASFTASPISQTQIDLTFSAASTITNATGYIILQRNGAAPTGAPADATTYTVGTAIGDGTVAALITNTADVTKSITGLLAGTQYHYTLFPYSGSGLTINYKTDGSVPAANTTTLAPLATTSEVSGPALVSQPNPTSISSLVTTDGGAVKVFDMDIYDYGVDSDPTKVTQLTIKAGTNNTANWSNTIQGVKLSTDAGATFVTLGTPTITTSSIVIPITSGNLNIPNNDALTVSLYVYLKSTGITDNQILEFKVDATAASHGFTADATGSTFTSTFASGPVSNQIPIDVVATKLAFVQQPGNTLANLTMSPAVTVEALDANNNRDLDVSGTVSITSSGTMTGSVSAVLASGFGTSGNIVHTSTGNSLALTASFSGLSNATSNNFNILQALAVGDILFLGYGTDDPDKFAFIAMNTIPEGTQISFTDNSWSGTVLASNENTGIYNAPAGGLSKGNIIQITGTTVTGGGTMSAGLTGLATSGDQILAYQGSSSSPIFIAGISSRSWLSTGSVDNNTSYLPSSLTINVNSTSFATEEDNGYYNGPTTLANGALAAFICNSANWTRSATIQTFPSWSFTIGNQTIVNSNSTIQDLTISNSESLTVNSAKQLTVSNTFTNNGTFTLKSEDGVGTATIITLGSVSGSGTTVVEQFISSTETGTGGRNWYISSPLSAATSSTITDATGNGLVYWNGSAWTAAGSTMDIMKGYIAKSPAGDRTIQFTGGLLNTGNQSVNDLALGFNLVGNPYPSSVDFAQATKTNVENSIWYRSKATNSYKFHTYNVTGGTGVNDGSAIIPPMQSFWIKTTSATNTFGFTNVMRSHQDQSVATNRLKAPIASTQKLLRLQIANSEENDETVVYFNANALDTYDAYDSPKMSNANAAIPEIYTTVGGEQLVINGLNSAVIANRELPLGFTTGASNNFTIKATEISNFDADTRIILKDNVLKAEYELNVGNAYNFSSDAVNTSSRFSILFRSATGPNALYDNNFSTLYIGKNANNQITINGVGAKDGMVTVCNAVGQKLISTVLTGSSLVIDKPFSTGVYLVTVNVGNAKVTKKVIIKAP